MEALVEISNESDFALENLPYGVFSDGKGGRRRVGVALGEYVVDLGALERRGYFTGPELDQRKCFTEEALNVFMGCGNAAWAEARRTLMRLLSVKEGAVRDDAALRKEILIPMDEVQMHLPCLIGDYTDFYACKTHALTVGAMFRGAEHALSPNWVHMPIAYHGRASSVVVSGTDIPHPRAQFKSDETGLPTHALSEKVDFELEMVKGLFIGAGNDLGVPIDIQDAWKHAFGVVLLNDWSLRDAQRWEGQPLGPFTSKNFATSISPWIVTMEALEPFKCDLPKQDPAPLPYLSMSTPQSCYDIQLEVGLQPEDAQSPISISKSNLTNTYWSFSQMIAHHTVTGCNLQPGNLLGTGTLSSTDPGGVGCFLEMTRNGTKPVIWSTPNGNQITRSYLEDGDEVILSGYCEKDNARRIGFGTCKGKILPNRHV